mgnify:FL=1
MELILDIGNTRTKYATFSNGLLESKGYCSDNELDAVIDTHIGLVKKVLVSSVKPLSNEREISFKKMSSNVLFLNSKLKTPFTNDYETPKTVGSDRLALAAGALLIYPNKAILIIDIGTCMTFDFVSDKGNYIGGAISPGLQMRLKALHQFTGKLPLVAVNEPQDLIGRNTIESILSGVVNGMKAEIDGIIDAYKLRYPQVKIILTGGDIAFFDKKLKNSIFADADILLKGMHFILEHNSDENN